MKLMVSKALWRSDGMVDTDVRNTTTASCLPFPVAADGHSSKAAKDQVGRLVYRWAFLPPPGFFRWCLIFLQPPGLGGFIFPSPVGRAALPFQSFFELGSPSGCCLQLHPSC